MEVHRDSRSLNVGKAKRKDAGRIIENVHFHDRKIAQRVGNKLE